MTRLHHAMPPHTHRYVAHARQARRSSMHPSFVEDWRAGMSTPPRELRHVSHSRMRRGTTPRETPAAGSVRDSGNTAPREGSRAAFALGLLTVVCAAGVASAAAVPGVSRASGTATHALRPIGHRRETTEMPGVAAPAGLSHSETLSGLYGLLGVWPTHANGEGVMAQCLPVNPAQAVGAVAVSAYGNEGLRAGLISYRSDIRSAVVSMIREAVATSDEDTRAAFAGAEILVPSRTLLVVERASREGSPPRRMAYDASHAVSLHLRNEDGEWSEFALSLAFEAPALITPVVCGGKRSPLKDRCFAETYGPVFWGERWASIESRIGENDEIRFTLKRAGASIAPGWPSPESSILDSPDMEEVAELLIETVMKHAPRDRREESGASLMPRSRRDAISDGHAVNALASRLSLTGLECLAAVVQAEKLHQHAISLLLHLWPDAPADVRHEAPSHAQSVPALIRHEPFSGAHGRGVTWSLPPDVYVEYLPDRAQNGVKVFSIDGELYGASVAHTRKHASDLRPLEDMRAEWGPESLCRISRGIGADVDGMCLECHGDREGEVSVTEQGATLTQHQAMQTSPMVRLRVAIYSHPFSTPDGSLAFFAFGRLGHFDDAGIPRVSEHSPVVDASVYTTSLSGEMSYYEQATTAGPIGGRRVRLTLGDMRIAVPFGTYRDRRHDVLHGVVQLSHDVYYRFTLPVGADARTTHTVQLHHRLAEHRDIREYRAAQNHRAAAENAIVLPSICYGEARTLLQLYLKVWQHAPSPADVWRGLEDISLSVVEARRAIHTLTQAIEHRVAAFRTPPASPGASGGVPPPEVDAALMPMFNRIWSHWQHYPAQADAFVNAISRDFVSRPAPLAVWSQLPFVGDVQTTRDVLSIFEDLFPGMEDLQGLVSGSARAARDVGDQMREVSGNANVAVAEVTLVDGTRTIYYCLSGLQQRSLSTNLMPVRTVDAGRAYRQRQENVISQRSQSPRTGANAAFTEPPHLRFVVADADLPTYNAASQGPQARTLDTERMILAQIYAEHPAGTNVIRSIMLCSRMPFCDSCAVNLAMVPYHYPDAELRFHYVTQAPRGRRAGDAATSVAPSPTLSPARGRGPTSGGALPSARDAL